jgi:hypothetical protein
MDPHSSTQAFKAQTINIDPRHHPAPHPLSSMDSKKNPNPLEWAALRPFKSWTPLHGEPGQPPIVWLGLI